MSVLQKACLTEPFCTRLVPALEEQQEFSLTASGSDKGPALVRVWLQCDNSSMHAPPDAYLS